MNIKFLKRPNNPVLNLIAVALFSIFGSAIYALQLPTWGSVVCAIGVIGALALYLGNKT